MDATALLNLGAYTAQVALVVAIGCALPSLLRLHDAPARFLYWRGVVLLCLALPWIQGRQAAGAAATPAEAVSVAVAPPSVAVADAVPSASLLAIDLVAALAAILAGGIVLRLLWMGAGLCYLRRLRHAGERFEDDDTRELQRTIAATADFRFVAGIRQPVTFGVARPVVLLPEVLRDHDRDIRRAVLTHELVHVRRRDWAWIVVEELVRAALWFNPAMWWLISRVQISREEVVDAEVVAITGKRRAYVEALLAFADSTPLAPAPAFARRRQLFRRLMLVSKEAVMSSTRIVVSGAVMALVVGGGSWYAVGAFPLQQGGTAVVASSEPGPLEKAAKPITPENPIPRRLASVPPDYPGEIAATGTRGTVVLRVTLDGSGRVAEVRRSSIWASGDAPQFDVNFSNERVENREAFVARQFGPKDARTVLGALAALENAAIDGVQRWSYEPPADAPISFLVTFTFAPNAATRTSQLASAPPARVVAGRGGSGMPGTATAAPEWTQGAMRVGGSIKAPMKIKDVKPVYPPEAQAARVSGVVILEVRVEPDGTVGNARVLRSIPMLNEAALEAVMQWQFTPTLLNGQPVPVIMTVTVNFTLQ